MERWVLNKKAAQFAIAAHGDAIAPTALSIVLWETVIVPILQKSRNKVIVTGIGEVRAFRGRVKRCWAAKAPQ